METKIKNAIIKSVTISKAERDILEAWLFLEYDAGGQGFGGYALYLPKSYTHYTEKGDFAGHFLFRCMEIAGADKWEDMKGKTIRVKADSGRIEAIGHIVKDDWFNPSEDFKRMGGE